MNPVAPTNHSAKWIRVRDDQRPGTGPRGDWGKEKSPRAVPHPVAGTVVLPNRRGVLPLVCPTGKRAGDYWSADEPRTAAVSQPHAPMGPLG